MTKKKWLPLLAAGVMTMGMFFAFPKTQVSAESLFDENDVVLSFTNMSDSHVGYGRGDEMLRNALTVSKTFAKNGIDALLFCGDQTQDGKKEQAETFISVLEEQFDLTETPAIITHGNHDTYWSGCMTTAQFAEAYGEKVYTFDESDTDYTTGNRHVIVNGYHFLSVQIQSYTGKNFTNPVSSDTETWLKATLNKITAENPNRYVFVSCHCPAPDTVYGSFSFQDSGPWGSSKELDAILKNYPQVILFSGHTHYALNDERSIAQTTYTQVQSGSTSDIDMDKGYAETGDVPLAGGIPDRRSQSQGMLVEVDGSGRIRIMRIDYTRAKQIKDYWYLEPCNAAGSHLNRYSAASRSAANVAPAFSADAKLKVTELSATSLQISYPVASDDDMVFSYTVSVYDQARNLVAEYKTLSPWYYFPCLSDLPAVRTHTISCEYAYPYTVEVVARDSFGGTSAPLSVTVQDTTEEDRAAAGAIDARVTALAGKTLSEEDGEEILAVRAEINGLSYKGKAFLTSYETFVRIEAEYYNAYRLTADASYAPVASDTYSIAATAAKGWTEDSEYTGVSFNWNATTKNNSLGFNRTFDLNGLHVSFANLSISSEKQTFAMLFSNVAKDKWLTGETLLLYVDFADGKLYVNDGVSVGQSDCLRYSDLGATPFDFLFTLEEDGSLTIAVHTIFGEESFHVAGAHLQNIAHFTDPSACYLSFSPWDSRTTGSFDVVSVHGGEDECKVYVSDPGGNGGEAGGGEEPGEEKKSGCGSVVSGGFAAIGTVAAATAAVLVRRKKRDGE